MSNSRTIFAAVTAAILPTLVVAEVPGNIASVDVLSGWRDGATHVAAIRITLAPGWKTYWRSPGDAGIPPLFDWSASRNVAGVQPSWPVPHVFEQNGMRSVGYETGVVIPLTVTLSDGAAPARLAGQFEIGVCQDVCVPVSFDLSADLAAPGASDPAIRAAFDAGPVAASSAGVTSVRCAAEPISDGLRLTARIAMPPLGDGEVAVLELPDPAIWISEAEVRREGDDLVAVADMVPPNGQPFLLDRSDVRITVIAAGRGVDIRGCTGG